MADEAGTGVVTPPAAVTPPVTPPTKVWDKFDSPDAAWKGLNEIRKTRGLPAVKPEGYSSIDEAGTEYRTLAGNKLAPETQPLPDTAGYAEIFAAANLDQKALGEKWVKNGKLDDADYAALKAVMPGATKAVIDQHYKAERAIAESLAKEFNSRRQQAQQRAQDIAGGETQFKTLMAFKDSLPEERKKNLAERLDSFDLFEGAMLEIKAEHERQTGASIQRPLVMGGMPAPMTGANTFEEWTALKAAARKGDAVARARLDATPPEKVMAFTK